VAAVAATSKPSAGPPPSRARGTGLGGRL